MKLNKEDLKKSVHIKHKNYMYDSKIITKKKSDILVEEAFEFENKIIYENGMYKEYTIYIDDIFNNSIDCRNLCQVLNMCQEGDIVKFIISSYGGLVDNFIQIYNSMMQCNAFMVGIVNYAYSAGALLALCCDKIIPNEFSTMMLHSMSLQIGGKIEELHNQADFNKKFDEKLIKKICKGFLNKNEIDIVLKGKDFWLDEEEIIKKLENWKPIRKVIIDCEH